MTTIIERIETDPELQVPSAETILAQAKLPQEERARLSSQAGIDGEADAKSRVMTEGNQQASQLDRHVATLQAVKDRIPEAELAERSRVDRALENLAGAHKAKPDAAEDLKKAEWRVRFTQAQVDGVKAVVHRSKGLLIISLVAALAGLMVDALFLAEAFLASEELVPDPTTAKIVAVGAALFLAAVAVMSGVLWALRRPQVRTDDADGDETDWENREQPKWRKSHRTQTAWSLVFAGFTVLVYGFLAALRLGQWKSNQAADISSDDALGFVVNDQRSSAIWVLLAVIAVAFLSLALFWWEGFNFGLTRLLKKYEEELPTRQREAQKAEKETRVDAIVAARVKALKEGKAELATYAGQAVTAVQGFLNVVVDAYKDGARSVWSRSKDPEIRDQRPHFETLKPSLTGSSPKGTSQATTSPGAVPTADQQPSATPTETAADDIDYGAGNVQMD